MVDAAGEGLASLRDAWKVQYVARAHMMAGVTLSELVQHTAATLAGEGAGVEATVAALVVDLDTGHLQAVMGGHPPPLLVRGDGTTEWLEASGRGIGDAGAGSQSVLSATLGAGDTLVLYTDGVVDAGADVIEGLSALRSTARALRLQPLPGLARRIGEATGGSAARTEQATVLAARLSPA
jgi:serine phosphatase RsbU (regulator of sigma subunit)